MPNVVLHARSDQCVLTTTAHRVHAHLTATHRDGESSLRVTADVVGMEENLVGRDDRQAVFRVVLPEAREGVEVDVVAASSLKEGAVAFSALIKGVIAMNQRERGDEAGAAKSLAEIDAMIKSTELDLNDLPTVRLPGGVTLKEALAAVVVLKKLKADGGSTN